MLDAFHARLRRSPFLQRFTAFTRVLLAVGFIPPGMKKVLGVPFTVLPTTHPVGYFFDAFFQAQAFYQFVGWAQVAAAVLLLFPQTATMGAVLYFPLIVTIAVVTVSIGFQGTWLLTLLMALACLYLLCWDYDRLRALLPTWRRRARAFGRREYGVQAATWGAAGVAAYGVMAWAGVANAWQTLGAAGFAYLGLAGALFGLVVAWHLRQMPADAAPAPAAGAL